MGNLDQVYKLFADQFEPDGQNFVYRKSMKGAPVRVSAAERDAFVVTYKRSVKIAIGLCVAAIVIMVFVLVSQGKQSSEGAQDFQLYSGTAAIAVVFMVVLFWFWYAPARALRERLPMGQSRTGTEVRRAMLERMSYGQLALFPIGAMLAILFKVSAKHDLLSGWNRLWIVAAVLICAAAAFNAFRKWRLESSKKQTGGA